MSIKCLLPDTRVYARNRMWDRVIHFFDPHLSNVIPYFSQDDVRGRVGLPVRDCIEERLRRGDVSIFGLRTDDTIRTEVMAHVMSPTWNEARARIGRVVWARVEDHVWERISDRVQYRGIAPEHLRLR